jgi:hypothetical protein
MAGVASTIGELRRKAIVTDEEITAAVDAYLDDPKVKAFQFTSGYVLDVAAAIEAHRPAKAALGEKGKNDAYRRTLIRTAVILAIPSPPPE